MPYAAPTVHWLVPNPHSALLTSQVVRRAVDLAINRERILRDVLGDGACTAGQVLSGPFPRGYAYDDEVAPAARDPRTAVALLHSDSRAHGNASRWSIRVRKSRTARPWRFRTIFNWTGWDRKSSCAKITSDDELPSASSWDLLYVEWQALEPARDVRTLFAGTQWGRGADPELDAVLEQLANAASREQAVVPLHAIHRRRTSNSRSSPCGRSTSMRWCTLR